MKNKFSHVGHLLDDAIYTDNVQRNYQVFERGKFMKKNALVLLIGTMMILAGCGSKTVDKADAVAAEVIEEASDATDDATEEVAEAVETIEDETTATTAEAAESSVADEVVEPEHTPMDISDCATFTDIVNKLQKDQGYTNVTIDGTDVLMVTDYAYDYDGNGEFVSIEADVYRYNGDQIEYLGYVCSGGTSYPLTIYDEKLYCSGNHYVRAYGMEDGHLEIDKEVYVNYDADGNATYYKVDDGKDIVIPETDEDVVEMYDFLDKGEFIKFDVIQ